LVVIQLNINNASKLKYFFYLDFCKIWNNYFTK